MSHPEVPTGRYSKYIYIYIKEKKIILKMIEFGYKLVCSQWLQ